MGVYGRMARLKGLMAALAILSTLTACSTGGGNPLDAITGESKYSPAFIKANIIPGKSTKEQIRQKFGAPTSAQDDVADNTSDWSYYRSDSGFNALKKVAYKYANKYGSGEVGSAMWQGESRIGDAQEVMEDASTVTGTQSTGRQADIGTIYIYFKGNVVDHYSTR
ncbi:hypothetical protein [Pseudomonas viridiflava]|uniref:hypothetical protein n=1 Tax=Pseudomonas viridiflava TaxID=33069 RepID=UPI001F11CD9D|nr:hypothetical protein [Pseudomonas viridiflava]